MFILQTHMVEAKKDHDNTDTNESANLPINQHSATIMALASIENEIDECDTKIIGKISITNKICCNIYCY